MQMNLLRLIILKMLSSIMEISYLILINLKKKGLFLMF